MSDYTADIRQAVAVLKKGGIILYPTDTIWGLGCDATNSEAVRRIFEIKHRADAKALITLVGSIAQLERTVDGVPEVAYDLLEFSERPTTIVYDRPNRYAGLAPELLAADGTIGVRLTKEDFSASLCRAFNRPLISTSANISGSASPRSFAEISEEIKKAVDYVCESRREETGESQPSVVMRLSESGLFKVLRS